MHLMGALVLKYSWFLSLLDEMSSFLTRTVKWIRHKLNSITARELSYE